MKVNKPMFIIKSTIKRIKVLIIKKAFRGARKLKFQNRSGYIQDILLELSHTRIDETRASNNNYYENNVRRFLISRLFNQSFKILLYASMQDWPLMYPIPMSWAKLLSRRGFEVNLYICQILWSIFILTRFIHDMIVSCKATVRLKTTNPEASDEYRVYLHNIPDSALQHNTSGKGNLLNWLQRHYAGKNVIFYHNNLRQKEFTIKNQKFTPIEPFFFITNLTLTQRLNLLISVFYYVSSSILEIKFYRLLISSDFHKYLSLKKLNFDECIFNNSDRIFRPMWSKDIKSTFLFYSVNYVEIDNKNPRYGWDMLPWDKFLAWNCKHREQLVRLGVSSEKIFIAGPQWFEGRDLKPSEILKLGEATFKVGLFDVAPGRSLADLSYAFRSNYYAFKNVKRFLDITTSVTTELEGHVYWKPKRDRGGNTHKYYQYLISNNSCRNVEVMCNSISPVSLIERLDAVVCLPFTSVAHIAIQEEKPAIYFDPLGVIEDGHEGLYGLSVVREYDELKSWLADVKSNVIM